MSNGSAVEGVSLARNGSHRERLRTRRLELIAATYESTRLELSDVQRLASWLSAEPIVIWPPPLNDESSQDWYLQMFQRESDAVGWGLWYLIQPHPARTVVGLAGFKGKPLDGSCEVGYSVFPVFQGQGYATEAVTELIGWAFGHADVNRIVAETLPDLHASIRVMQKCHMQYVGEGKPEDNERTVRYEITRSQFKAIGSVE